MTNHHKVTTPDGVVHTRNSKTRVYTHAIIGYDSATRKEAAARGAIDHSMATAAKYSDPAVCAKIEAESMARHGRNIHDFADYVANAEAHVAELVAAIDAGYEDDPWCVLRWSGAEHTAEKAMGTREIRWASGLKVVEVEA